MNCIPEPKLKQMLMNKEELSFGDGEINERKEEFRIQHKLIDIVGINRDLKVFYLIELKSKGADTLALSQLLTYKHLFEESLRSSPEYKDYSVQCYLIASKTNQETMFEELWPKVKFVNYNTMIAKPKSKLWPSQEKLLKIQGNALKYKFPPK